MTATDLAQPPSRSSGTGGVSGDHSHGHDPDIRVLDREELEGGGIVGENESAAARDAEDRFWGGRGPRPASC
jgi:hypothetical protein